MKTTSPKLLKELKTYIYGRSFSLLTSRKKGYKRERVKGTGLHNYGGHFTTHCRYCHLLQNETYNHPYGDCKIVSTIIKN